MAAYLYIRPTTKSGKYQIVRKSAGNRFYVVAEAFNEPAAESIVASLNTNNVMIPENPELKKAS